MLQVLVGLSPTFIAIALVLVQWLEGVKRRRRTAHKKYGIWK